MKEVVDPVSTQSYAPKIYLETRAVQTHIQTLKDNLKTQSPWRFPCQRLVQSPAETFHITLFPNPGAQEATHDGKNAGSVD